MGKKSDLTNMRFRKLTAIHPTEKRKNGAVVWLCKCDCGNKCLVKGVNLKSGTTGSCGCYNFYKDLINLRFGRLLVQEKTSKRKDEKVVWKCKCDCGNITYVKGSNLTGGDIKSCGCFGREILKKIHKKNFKHGDAAPRKNKHPLYTTWRSMKIRCLNEKGWAYKYYGSRGIGIFTEWRNDYKKFKDWCMENGWFSGSHMHRIDHQQGYSPGNICFLTPPEHMRLHHQMRKSREG